MKYLTKTSYIALWSLLTLSALIFPSCKDKTPNNSPQYGNLDLEFTHTWGLDKVPFYLNQVYVHPQTKDTITIDLLKYYISNLSLTKTDGSNVTIENSYFLIDPENNKVTLTNIPSGEYKEIQFLIGVDSLKNFSGLQTGALNPSHGMFWSWSTGYIFVRVEGASPQSPTRRFMYHLGGYEAPFIASNKKTISLGNDIIAINPQARPKIHLNVNTARFWHGMVKVEDLNVIHNIGEASTLMSKNFADGFVLDHVHK